MVVDREPDPIARMVLAGLAALAVLLPLVGVPPAAAQADQVIGIPLRTPTQVSLDYSRHTFPDGGATEVLLGRADDFPDSLAAGSLAGDRPLLLTDPDYLSAGIAEELERLGAAAVTVLGGEAAISRAVTGQLDALGYGIGRLAGASRIETAVEVARTADADTAILARAFPAQGAGDPTQAFADSLAAGAWAAETGWPVLLTQSQVLTGSTRDHLAAASYDRVVVVGGPAAVSDAVVEEVRGLAGEVVRVAGPTRFATAAAIAAERGVGTSSARIVLTDGQTAPAWTAGFAASSHAAAFAAPVLLAAGPVLHPDTREALSQASSAQDDGVTLVCSADPAACAAAVELLGGDAPATPAVAVEIDGALTPDRTVLRPDGSEAPMGAMESAAGGGMDFASDELVVLGDDALVDRLRDAYGARVLAETPLPDDLVIPAQDIDEAVAPMFLDGIDRVVPQALYRIKLDELLLPAVDPAALASSLSQRDPLADTTLSFSDQQAMDTFGAAHALEHAGVPTLLNLTLGLDQAPPTPLVGRHAQEAATAPGIAGYDPNPWTWDWLDGPNDFGVPDAWRALSMAGVRPGDGGQLTLGILDGGFPAHPELGGAQGTDATPNTATCGGNPCPYHGFSVAVTAGGVVDNGRGTAGVSGGFADLNLANTALVDVSIFRLISDIIDATAESDAINISASEVLPELPDGVAAATALNIITGAFAASGKAIFASAGNVSATDGLLPADADIDAVESLGIFGDIETQRTIPCELEGVECVGGIEPSSTRRDAGSWYGDHDVDWWAPFTVYAGPEPAGVPAAFTEHAHRVSGTSVSSPWAAAAYLLIRRSDPAVDRGRALALMRTTARTGVANAGGTARRILQPYDAVVAQYGGVDPFEVDWRSPVDGQVVDQGNVDLSVQVTDPLNTPTGGNPAAPLAADVTWWLNGTVVGTTTNEVVSSNSLQDGANTVTLEVRHGRYTWVQERTLNKGNTPPTITITAPEDGSTWTEGQTIPLEADSFDPNEPGLELPDSAITWDAAGVTRTGATTSVSADALGVGTHTITVTGDDGQATATDSVTITVSAAGPGNQAPDPQISQPAAGDHDINCSSCTPVQYYESDLVGSAADPEDGALTGSALVWQVVGDHDGDGVAETRDVGTGRTVPDVRFNIHGSSTSYTIRLTATDSEGASSVVTRSIRANGLG